MQTLTLKMVILCITVLAVAIKLNSYFTKDG